MIENYFSNDVSNGRETPVVRLKSRSALLFCLQNALSNCAMCCAPMTFCVSYRLVTESMNKGVKRIHTKSQTKQTTNGSPESDTENNKLSMTKKIPVHDHEQMVWIDNTTGIHQDTWLGVALFR